MEIRKMTIDDYESVYKIWTNTAGVGMRSIDDSRQGIEKFLMRNPGTNFVAEVDGQTVGVILCGNDGRRGYIYHTAVKKELWNKGIGRALVDAGIEALKKEGINKAALVVFVSNENGNRFWESMGFEKRDDLIYRNMSINELNI
jgi:ribosomal protein S18 acetylase RimI-like enzyme